MKDIAGVLDDEKWLFLSFGAVNMSITKINAQTCFFN